MQHKNPQEFWRSHVQGWLQSGLIPAHYCIQQGINAKTFSRWKIKFHGPAPKPVKRKTDPISPQPPIPLVAIPIFENSKPDVGLVKMDSATKCSGINLQLPKNRHINLDVDFDERTLQRLLAILEQA